MDPGRSRKLAHLSYVAPLVALVAYSQAEAVFTTGGYPAKAAITLLVLLLVGGFLVAVYAFAHIANEPQHRFPAVVGILSNLAGAGLIVFWLMRAT